MRIGDKRPQDDAAKLPIKRDDAMDKKGKQEGWYYKKDGTTFGPVSTLDLNELLACWKIAPRQAVWRQERQGKYFLHAVTAVSKRAGVKQQMTLETS